MRDPVWILWVTLYGGLLLWLVAAWVEGQRPTPESCSATCGGRVASLTLLTCECAP